VGAFSLSSFRILIVFGLRGGEWGRRWGRVKKLCLVLVVFRDCFVIDFAGVYVWCGVSLEDLIGYFLLFCLTCLDVCLHVLRDP
jgi:hypothetical protein